MVLKVNDTSAFNISLKIDIDYDKRDVSFLVEEWDKKKNSFVGRCYDADEFGKAIDDYTSLENKHMTKA